jgi:O-acetyl-ADP-ribose deacetylase (regulator of RNase III)
MRSDGASITAVDRRLEARAGADVADRVAAQGDSPVGTAFLTPGGETEADFLIHLVVQSPEEPVGPQGLGRALRNGLRRAADFGIASVALAPLGTGAGQLPVEESARIVLGILNEHRGREGTPGRFLLVAESGYEAAAFREAAAALSVVLSDEYD